MDNTSLDGKAVPAGALETPTKDTDTQNVDLGVGSGSTSLGAVSRQAQKVFVPPGSSRKHGSIPQTLK